ncbi:hypothetical protein JTE90_011847 [Oedothorax gibbosus]|uniref:sn-1-specific diacylglycerol lipase ABHD11 n=1 Tax=Oedothorax gibbosus TaxID=931172 RepID=A0AAV6U128_9ARAC|nr:hypothetical protein JTE90_011847 [Oedothorax gibbosus]
MSGKIHVTLAFSCCKPDKVSNQDLSPIILHHGCMNYKERWTPIQQDLANATGRNVYAVDARNHGSSERSENFNYDILSDDLRHFMDTHNIDKACLVGHSMGGLVVMTLALKSPDRVEKLVVEDVSPKDPGPKLYDVYGAMIEEQLKCFEESTDLDTEGSMQQKLRECLFRTVPMIPDKDQEVINDIKFPIKKAGKGYESLTNLKSVLNAVRNPPICHFPTDCVFEKETMFIYGLSSDFSVIQDKDLILKYFPKATFSGIEDAGHDICPRKPKRFVEEISKIF